MSRVPLVASDGSAQEITDRRNMVMLEAGLPGDSWTYCVEREQLARKSKWFRAMLTGPFAPPVTDSPPLLRLQHVDKRAFDHFLRYLHNEPIKFISVSTARATLDAAYQYLCPELARLAAAFLQKKLDEITVLEIYQGLRRYANNPTPGSDRSPHVPMSPADEANEIDD